jgi:hypothetical protein
MISWKSLHVMVDRGAHGQAEDGDQHELLRGSWADQQGSAAPDGAATHDRLPDSGWTVLAARPVAQVRQVSAHRRRAAEGSGEHYHQRLHLGRTFLLGC